MKAKTKQKSPRKKRTGCLFRILLVLGLSGVFLVVILTPWGLSRLTPALEWHLSKRLGLEVQIQGLALHWPLGASVSAFSATDENGEVRLGVKEARVQISLRKLLRRQILIHNAEAAEVLFAGLPESKTKPKAKAWKFPQRRPDMESRLDQVELRHLKIRHLVLAPPLLSEPHVLSVEGQWRLRKLSLEVVLISRGGEQFTEQPHMKGQFTVSGTLQNPAATLQLDVQGLRPEDPELWDGPPARFKVELALLEQRLQGGFRLENLPGDPVTLDLDIPAPLSLSPFSFRWPPDGSVEARFSANTDLAGLGRLFVLDVYHRLAGTLTANIHLQGTFNDPRLAGSIRLEGGRYEHELSGTILSDIILKVAAEREFLSLVNFSASDGAAGTVQASGRMHFRPAERYPFETILTLNSFRLMKNDQAEARGQGSLKWEGNVTESRLSGQMQVSPMTLNIPENLPPRLYALEVAETHAAESEAAVLPVQEQNPEEEKKEKRRPPRHRVIFDLLIDAPDRVFVRGRGLDSEWSAHIQVKGQLPEPQLTGSLNMLRGRFSFFGKRLVINRGIVTFDGAFPPSPLLDLEATLHSGGIIAILRVQGPATDSDIVLASSPPMPEDEILARLLFAREAARITPWQALTLAQAVNKLRGGGSAFDLMGETRRVLRVDQIDVRTPEDEQSGTTVTVGKYISDRVYMELERNSAEESGRARVEVEITPSLRLETRTGGNADSGIGIIWTWDY